MDYPLLVFLISFVGLWLSGCGGAWFRRRQLLKLARHEQDDIRVELAAVLTLLALIIGFSFSMAITRYDNRMSCEEIEANAIGTEYARAGLLPHRDAIRIRELLAAYLNQRISYYETRNKRRLSDIEQYQSQLQSELWSAIEASAAVTPTPITALVVAGMNNVLDSQGFTQAAWWNRIPAAAWALMTAIAICSNGLFGYSARFVQSKSRVFMLLPAILSISFFLIADLDSPRGGVIRVHPRNLESVRRSLAPSPSGLPMMQPPEAHGAEAKGRVAFHETGPQL